jgi:predicted ABC-type ATPase
MPVLYIIAGPNGAGKTTIAQKFLPEKLNVVEFVNADNIAKGLSPFNPEGVAFEAGRIMLARIKELAKHRIDFAFETTLSTLSYASFINECKKKEYEVVLIFVWLNSSELAKRRVAQRVSEGGHNIDDKVIETRYYKGLKNLKERFVDLCDDWIIIDNSGRHAVFVAESKKLKLKIIDKVIYKTIFKNDEKRN